MYAHFNRFSIKMTKQQALSASHPGSCDAAVDKLFQDKNIRIQLGGIDCDNIAAELKDFGAWDEEELRDTLANYKRILWIAAGNIVEEIKYKH